MTIDSKDTMPEAHFRSQDALENNYWWHCHRRDIAMDWLRSAGLPSSPSILDLGCGTGGFLERLASELGASRVVGLDASPVAVDAASAKGFDIRQADLVQTTQLPDPPFDAVAIMDVLEHLPDERPVLATALSNLRPGGLLMVSVPAYQFLFSSWDRHLGHYRRYTRSRLERTLRESAFEVIRSSYAFSLALLPAILRRFFGGEFSEQTCVFPPLPRLANGLARSLNRIELRFLRMAPMPFGLSVCALARKPNS